MSPSLWHGPSVCRTMNSRQVSICLASPHSPASQRFSSFVEAERLARARRNRLKMPELKDLRQQLTSKAVEQGHLRLGEVIARDLNSWTCLSPFKGLTLLILAWQWVNLWDLICYSTSVHEAHGPFCFRRVI